MKLNYLDLFSGIGGFPLGLQMAGFEFTKHYHSEIDEYANKVYAKHFPAAVNLGDVTGIKPKKIGGGCDIITAGFPCQDISVAGKQKGLQGVRSGLFYEIIRIASACRPRIILLENVSNLLGIHDGADFGAVLGALAEIGYDAEWHCVPASHVGAPHRRDRVWVVCYPQHAGFNATKNTGGVIERGDNNKAGAYQTGEFERSGVKHENVADTKSKRRREAREHSDRSTKRPSGGSKDVPDTNERGLSLPGAEQQTARFTRIRKNVPNAASLGIQGGWTIKEQIPEAHAKKKLSMCRYSRAGASEWPAEPNVGRVANGIPSRVDRIKCLGNAVVPQVVGYIARTILIPILESEQ